MSSSRKSSVKRHIKNYNIHSGQASLVSFVEYSIGLRHGKYQVQNAPTQPTTQSLFLERILDKITADLESQIAKDIAKRIYDELSTDQIPFNNLKQLAKTNIISKNYFRTLMELRPTK